MKDDNARLTPVPLKPLFNQLCGCGTNLLSFS